MKNIVIILVLLLLGVNRNYAQETNFNKEVTLLASEIQERTYFHKELLKARVDSVNTMLQFKEITKEQGDSIKQTLANASALELEKEVTRIQEELSRVVQHGVEMAIKQNVLVEELDTLGKPTPEYIPIVGIQLDKNRNFEDKRRLGEKRNSVLFDFTYGMSNLVTDGALANSDIRYIASNFVQFGFSFKSRLKKDSSLLYLKWGFLAEYNSLKPTEKRYFYRENNQTVLGTHEKNLRKSRLGISSFHIPLFLEFDLTPKKIDDKTGRVYFRTHQTFRFGVGAYVNISSPKEGFQVYHYRENDAKYRVEERTDLSINQFRYGVATYLGYRGQSLYFQYDLNPIFKENKTKQHIVSMGIKFEL